MPDLINRPKFESRLADTLAMVFEKYRLRIQTLLSSFDTKLGDLKHLPPSIYTELQNDLVIVLKEVLIEAYIQAFTSFDGMLSDNSTTSSRRGALFIREDANDWASYYAPQLAGDIANVTEQRLREIADRSPLLPMSGLGIGNVIKKYLGIGRAFTIARTEITNVISISEQSVINNFETLLEATMWWFTRKDERVCIICRPRHKKPQGSNWQLPPPAHPRCRCKPYWRIQYPDGKVVWVRFIEDEDENRVAVTIGD